MKYLGTINDQEELVTKQFVEDQIAQVKIEWQEFRMPPLPIGGRIFYIDDTASGATYTFYDASGNILPTQTVEGLENAVGYEISGTPSKDKFYVYDNTSHTTDSITVVNGLAGQYQMYWDENLKGEIGITSDGIGKGKSNTATALAFTSDWGNNDIWSYIKNCNNDNLNACNDWFIASMAEQDKLREASLVDWYLEDFKSPWSSVEIDSRGAYVWYQDDWRNFNKYINFSCFAARAF